MINTLQGQRSLQNHSKEALRLDSYKAPTHSKILNFSNIHHIDKQFNPKALVSKSVSLIHDLSHSQNVFGGGIGESSRAAQVKEGHV